MEKYILTTTKIEGEITFGYNSTGYLVYFTMPENLDDNTSRALLKNLPRVTEELERITTGRDVKIQKVPEDLSFDKFWRVYDKKINRKRAEPLYNKLKDGEKMLAMMRVADYKDACSRLKRGVADPEKYIRDAYFETDWKREK